LQLQYVEMEINLIMNSDTTRSEKVQECWPPL
jgi:hypothetical protein